MKNAEVLTQNNDKSLCNVSWLSLYQAVNVLPLQQYFLHELLIT